MPRGGARRNAGGTVRPLGISLEDGKRLKAVIQAHGIAYSQEAVRQWIERHIAADYEATTATEAKDWQGEVL